MSQISLSVSREHGSSITVNSMIEGNECLSIQLETKHSSGHIYSKDHVYVHGTVEDMRYFAEQMLAALPVAEVAEQQAA